MPISNADTAHLEAMIDVACELLASAYECPGCSPQRAPVIPNCEEFYGTPPGLDKCWRVRLSELATERMEKMSETED